MALRREGGERFGACATAQQAYLSVLRTADQLVRGVVELLRPFDLSPAQYNVLRILRGAGPDGRRCGDISESLVTREPDTTRLLDRMARRGLISRARSETDRRVVLTRITPEGLELLGRIDGPLAALHDKQFGTLSPEQVATLVRLLELTRKS